MNFIDKLGIVLYWITAVGPVINVVVGAVKGIYGEVSKIISEQKSVLKGTQNEKVD